MAEIKVDKQVAQARLQELGVLDWPIWEKEVSDFPWHYDTAETCYFITGDVEITPEGGKLVQMGQGDLVTFPAGMSCRWNIRQPVRKHYSFGD
jgi:uncharacterized protein